MNKYKTIKDCAVDIICKEGDRLTNKQIAQKVKKIMINSNTSYKCIAWYKNKIRLGIIKINNAHCKWLDKVKKIDNEIICEDLDEIIFQNESERYVYNKEKKRTGKYPKKSPKNSHLGYDFDSGDRHIEVKSNKKSNKKWLALTPNESEKLLKDPKYWLYLVEGNFDNNPDKIKMYMIPKEDLLEMSQLKVILRLTRLGNKTKREEWLFRK